MGPWLHLATTQTKVGNILKQHFLYARKMEPRLQVVRGNPDRVAPVLEHRQQFLHVVHGNGDGNGDGDVSTRSDRWSE